MREWDACAPHIAPAPPNVYVFSLLGMVFAVPQPNISPYGHEDLLMPTSPLRKQFTLIGPAARVQIFVVVEADFGKTSKSFDICHG